MIFSLVDISFFYRNTKHFVLKSDMVSSNLVLGVAAIKRCFQYHSMFPLSVNPASWVSKMEKLDSVRKRLHKIININSDFHKTRKTFHNIGPPWTWGTVWCSS